MYSYCLNDDKLTEILLDYVNNDRTNQAFLIDGQWGSGKTYFIKEIFIKKYETYKNNLKCNTKRRIDEKRKSSKDIYYISLYGLNDVAQIEAVIYEKMVETYVPEKKAGLAIKLLRISGKALPSLAQRIGIVNSSNIIKEAFRAIKPIRDMIIVFDDLERCSIELNGVLGYINNLVEHCNVKAIILANEKEIWRAGFAVHLAEKYDVTLNYLKALPDGMAGEINTLKNLKDVKNIQKHAEKLFSQDAGYEIIKEKLVGTRVEYRKPLSESYNSVLNAFVEDGETKLILEEYKETVLAKFEEEDNINIRVLIAVFINYQKIVRFLQSVHTEYDELLNEIKINMLNYLSYCIINIKTGHTLEAWEDNVFSRLIMYNGKDNEKKFIYGYAFINTLATCGYIDESKTAEDLQRYLASEGNIIEYQKFINNSALKELVNWHFLGDEEVKKYLWQLKMELKNRKYNVAEFGKIVRALAEIEHMGFQIDYKEYVVLMKEALVGMELNNLTIANFSSYDGESNIIKRYREEMKPIFDQIESEKLKKRMDIYTGLNTCVWDEAYVQMCRNNRDLFLQDKKFLASFDVNNYEKRIQSASAREVYCLLNAIKEVYNFDNIDEWFIADAENLDVMLKHTINSLKVTEKITLKANLDELSKHMREYLSRFGRDTEKV